MPGQCIGADHGDKALIDFQVINVELAQVTQAGMAGAKIINGNHDPQCVQLAKQLMDIMTQEPVTLEELVELSGRSLAEISGELLDLQMQGKLGLADGRRYYRI